MKSITWFYRVSVLALIATAVSTGDAANRAWINSLGGSWEVPANWSPTGSPTNTDSIRITANGTYDVNFNNTTANTGDSNGWLTVFETLIQGDGILGVPTLLVDFTNAAKQLTLTYTGGDALQINQGGRLILSNGTVSLVGGAQIGFGVSSTGTLQVAGGLFRANGMGVTRPGLLTVSGGVFTNTGSFIVDGRYNVLGGTSYAGGITVANGTTARGTILMNGGALNMSGTLTLGNSGRGTFLLSNGTFSVNNVNIGDNGGTGAGGDWNLYGGSASVAGALNIAPAVQSTGSVLVAGGSLSVSGATTVGSGGEGSLVVSNGSFSGSSISIGGPSSRVEQHGGTITLTGNLTVNASLGQTGTVVTTGGTLSVGGSATVGSTQNGEWLISGGTNTINGSLSFADSGASSRGKIVMNGGSLSVGGTTYMANSGRATFIMSNGTFTANAISMGDNGGLGAGGDWSIYGGSASVGGTLRVGNQSIATSSVLVANSGLLEIKSSITLGHPLSGLGTLTNRDGGTLRFTAQNNPTITINSGSTAVMSNATLEFKDASAALIFGNVTNITRSGNNTLSLNHASNATVAVFTADNAGSGDYKRLALTNGSRFRATTLNVSGGGEVRGGAGDVVEIGERFNITRATNPSGAFDLSRSTVEFTGGIGHTNLITGKDFGSSGTPDGFTAQNFSYGVLRLNSPTDEVCFLSGDNAPSNALYVTWLDLAGTNLVSNLHAPTNINLYYRVDDPGNAYLGGNQYQLTDCDGGVGGFLLPAVPEPTTLTMGILAAGALFAARRRRR